MLPRLGCAAFFGPDIIPVSGCPISATRQGMAMDEAFEDLLAELEQFGASNDASISDRPRRMLNITRDTGEFLAVLVRATAARRALEIGTSNGYSSLCEPSRRDAMTRQNDICSRWFLIVLFLPEKR
jgi:O-methyltransferase